MFMKTVHSKKILCAALTAGAFGLLLTTSSAFAAADTGPAEMILKTAKGRKPASFPHAKHQAVLQCAACHHGKNDDGTQKPFEAGQAIQKCVVCHNKTDMKNSKLNSFKNAAHARCKTCHKTLAKAKKTTGPTKCNGCHIKK